MKKITVKNDKKDFSFFINEKIIDLICNLAGGNEQGGYILVSKVKDTIEFHVEMITHPHKKDLCNETSIHFSRKHQKIAKKIKQKNPQLYEIGFYHTHPEWFGCEPSNYDISIFEETANKHRLNLFIIGISDRLNVLIYMDGKEIKKETLWKKKY